MNKVISTEGARYVTMDIKYFYLSTPLEKHEYATIPIKKIPNEIIDQYNLLPITRDEHVLIEIRKGMYGLP